jgi:2-polyprenyl-6-methoxyphenol hydroxylase-like FAD-dependent oxidoreductase
MILTPSYANRATGRTQEQRLFRWKCGGVQGGARITLLDDASHATLPFMAQGAAQAIEDGAALAACLSNIDTRHVPQALNRYERLRLPRATRVQGLSEGNKQRFHLPDGPAQLKRDAEIDWLYWHDAGTVGDSDAHCVSRRPSNSTGVGRESNELLTE